MEITYIKKKTKFHREIQKEGNNFDWRIWEGFMKELTCELRLKVRLGEFQEAEVKEACIQGQKNEINGRCGGGYWEAKLEGSWGHTIKGLECHAKTSRVKCIIRQC